MIFIIYWTRLAVYLRIFTRSIYLITMVTLAAPHWDKYASNELGLQAEWHSCTNAQQAITPGMSSYGIGAGTFASNLGSDKYFLLSFGSLPGTLVSIFSGETMQVYLDFREVSGLGVPFLLCSVQ